MNKILLVLFAIFISNSVFAECGGNNCNFVKITEMHVFYDGTVWVATTGTETNLTNCTTSSSMIKVDTTTVGGKNIYSALLSAQARDKNVQLRTMDNTNPCQVHYAVVE